MPIRGVIIVTLLSFIAIYFSIFSIIYPIQGGKTTTLEEEKSPSPPERLIDLTLKEGETIYSLLSTFRVPPLRITQLLNAANGVYDLGRVKAGTGIRLSLQGEDIKSLKLPIDEVYYLVLEDRSQEGGGFLARREAIPYEKRPVLASGTIKSSLYEDGIQAGLEPDVIMDMADIFAWEIDFASDVREGDSFNILYEANYLDGRFVRNGKIKASRFVNDGKTYTAIYFKDRYGHADYYDIDGRSLRRQFLKSPLNYRRISSYYSKGRFHPILKFYRPHHGVDYTARAGTPVVSAGDGRVEFIGRKGEYGNLIVIRHNGVYSTAYGHLSRFKKGLRKGKAVKQGEVIGYVGSTGLTTGPHLHYEFRVRGRPINPLAIKLPPSAPVREEDRGEFERLKGEVMARLDGGISIASSQ